MKWLSEKDTGIADAMNKGFRMASGSFISWIDADNYYDDKVYDYVLSQINSNPEIDIICGYISIVDKKGSKVYNPGFPFSLETALTRNTGGIPLQPGTFFKKRLFDEVGGFDTTYKVAGDYDFWVNVLKKNPKIAYSEMIFGYYKKEDEGASQSVKGIIKGYKEMLSIGKKNNQSLYGKMLLTYKYTLGLLSIYKKKILS
jgi:glycosyltransferase involved in cell wall biosynthesis